MSVDWFDIEIGNAIENLNLNDIMTACYDSSAFTSEPSCGLFTRDGAGQVVDFRTGYVNVSVVEFAGLQATMQFATDIGRFGDVNISLDYLYTEKHLETPGSGNTQRFDGEIGESAHRVTAGVSWNISKWTWFNQFRWLDSAVFDNTDNEFSRDIKGVDDWLVVNSSLAYQFTDDLNARLTVDNLLDNDAPFAATAGELAGIGIVTYYPGILGRYVRLQANYRF